MLSSLTVEELCRKLKPVFGKKIDQLYLKYSLTTDRELRMEIERTLNALYHKHLNEGIINDKILLQPPSKEAVAGEYPLGLVSYADKEEIPFCLREKDWMRHMCVSGMSGSGKTTFAFYILKNFIRKDKPFLVFDWKKSFRPLLREDKNILCFTVGNERITNFFRLNINRPPRGVGPKEWIMILSDILSESYFTSFGVHKLISETLDEAFRDFGVYDGSENYPTWVQIKDRLEDKANSPNMKSMREQEWVASALRIAHSLTFGSFGEVVNYKGQDLLDIEELLKNKVIFELESLNQSEKKFFCEYVLTYIYKLMKKNYDMNAKSFNNAIIVDEAHNIFLKDKTNFMKEGVTDMIYREVREYGISLICLDQHVSKLSDTVAGNSACNIAFQQILPADIETISKLMQMHETRRFFSMLPVGYAIVKLAERYHEPFMIHVPFMDIKSNAMTDKDIHDFMQEKVREYKRKKLFMDSVDDKNLTRAVERMDNVFKATGVKTDKEFVEALPEVLTSFENQIKEIRKDQNKEKEKVPLRNHLQGEVFDIAEKEFSKGRNVADIKDYLLNMGYSRTDVNTGIKKARLKYERTNNEPVRRPKEDSLITGLREYILRQLSSGHSLEDVKRYLAGYGYSKEVIDRAAVANVADDQINKKPKSEPVPGNAVNSRPLINVSDRSTEQDPHPSTIDSNNSHSLENLTQPHWDFLHEIHAKNFGVSELYKQLELSARKGNTLKNELLEQGLIELQEIKDRSGWTKKVRLTRIGLDLVEKQGIPRSNQ